MELYSELTDIELVALLINGEVKAFTEIYNRYQPLLFLHARKKNCNEEEAKDIIQEIFTDLWTRRECITLKTQLAPYLYTCVRNKIVNLLKHHEVRLRYVDSFAVFLQVQDHQLDEALMEKQLLAIINREIEALPPKMRLVFQLSKSEHKSYKEISETLKISEETVKKQVKNALKILRGRLGRISRIVFIFLK